MRLHAVLLAALLSGSGIASAQDEPAAVSVGSQEIVVTGSRINVDGYNAQTPAVGLNKVADFAHPACGSHRRHARDGPSA